MALHGAYADPRLALGTTLRIDNNTAASGDPRMSIEERYGDIANYTAKLREAINRLVSSGYLLPTDAKMALNKNVDYVLKNKLFPVACIVFGLVGPHII